MCYNIQKKIKLEKNFDEKTDEQREIIEKFSISTYSLL